MYSSFELGSKSYIVTLEVSMSLCEPSYNSKSDGEESTDNSVTICCIKIL